MLRFTALLAGALLSANAFALSLANLSQTDASGGLKDALSQGAQIAVKQLGKPGGFTNDFVGKGSDLGGGCSTMGTLSGGGNIVISVGEGCLIGANAGIGIPLGDRNIVEAGLYVTAGTKIALLDDQNNLVKVVKGRDLAGQPDLLFRRNSQTGAVECKTNKTAIELNEALHAHN